VTRGSSVLLACLLFAAPAHAQSPQAAAVVQFDKGRALLKQNKFEEACKAFNESQKLDPANGTLFNIAECSEKIGKLATAWLAYRELAQTDTNAGRKSESTRRAKALEKRMPKLLVRIDDAPPGLVVTINDKDSTALLGNESPVDLGEYKIHATAPGYEPFDRTENIATEGKTVKVSLELDETPTAENPTPKKKHRAPPPETPTSHRGRNGALLGVAGGAALVTGVIFGLKAKSNWSDAEDLCPDHTCTNPMTKMRGDDLVASARSDATKSTVLVILGAAIGGAGIYLIATKPNATSTTALRLLPHPTGGALVLDGRF
jgi:hypothetical protein